MFRKTKDLEGFELRATDGTIGHIEDFYFDDAHWFVRYFVVNAGTWLNSRRVLISPVAVNQPEWENKRLPVSLTKEQVRNSPGIDTNKPVSRQKETELTQYYGWPYYWTSGVTTPAAIPLQTFGGIRGPAVAGPTGQNTTAAAEVAQEEGDPHLHSVHDVRGYRIKASDGGIGHVDDFLLDDTTWGISHLVVDTRNWWPGKKVLISPQWIAGVSWDQSDVVVDLTRDAVRRSPEYDSEQTLTPTYIDSLHDYYGKPRFERHQ